MPASLRVDAMRGARVFSFNIDAARRRSRASIKVLNQHGNTVAVAEHILKWVANA
jgi:hypothetical protein